jgi:hypothetical protein
MEVYQPFFLLILVGFGFLVMIGIIPRYKVFKYLMMIILFIILMPMLFSMGAGKWRELSLMNWPWWYYPVGFLAALIVLRLIINFIFPNRER